ncbi:hypothetical protein THICB2_50010 [Thiomonas sp. CB2]|nr:hypothetical protein THICB2_50010 [Thiomonas sp. CB2]
MDGAESERLASREVDEAHAPIHSAAAWAEPNPSSLQAARWTRKLEADLGFLIRHGRDTAPSHRSVTL